MTATAPTPELTTPAPAHDPYAALRFRDFRLLASGRFAATMGEQMLNVAIGYELYARTHEPLALGLVGLVQVLPVLLLSLPAGHIADIGDRKRIALVAQVGLGAAALGLAALSAAHGPLPAFYACLLLIGIANAFASPAETALLPRTVPPEAFTNAASWSSSSWQLAAVVGPALGGVVIGLGGVAAPVYLFEALACVAFVLLLLPLRDAPATAPAGGREPMLRSLAAGLRYLFSTKVILGAITLDLFAVLLGGAVTLLPIYALDILHVGPQGLGWLRAAPSVGAVTMALLTAHLPPFRRAGRTLLLAVAGFGAATIVFGLSRSFPLSLAMLVLLGALDNISVVLRSTLLLLRTPDEMRGRLAAVNSVFVSASNELGGFESGVAASLFGPVAAVVGGGIGTILVVLAVARAWPELRTLGRLAPDPAAEVEDDVRAVAR